MSVQALTFARVSVRVCRNQQACAQVAASTQCDKRHWFAGRLPLLLQAYTDP